MGNRAVKSIRGGLRNVTPNSTSIMTKEKETKETKETETNVRTSTRTTAEQTKHRENHYEGTEKEEYNVECIGNPQEVLLHCETLQLVETTHFTYDEITMLRCHIALLDHIPPHTLTLHSPVIRNYLEIHSSSLYLLRLYHILDFDHKGYITFSNIIHGLSILCQRATRKEKYKLSFQLLDLDQKGYLTYDNIYHMIDACIKEAQMYGYLNLRLTAEQINAIIVATFTEADLNQNQTIEYNEYIQICDLHPGILQFITLDISSLLQRLDSKCSSRVCITKDKRTDTTMSMEDSMKSMTMTNRDETQERNVNAVHV